MAFRETSSASHLIVHLGDVVEEGKVLVLHLDEVGHDLVQVGLRPRDLLDLLEGVLVPVRKKESKYRDLSQKL